jgi:hypothetical protein
MSTDRITKEQADALYGTAAADHIFGRRTDMLVVEFERRFRNAKTLVIPTQVVPPDAPPPPTTGRPDNHAIPAGWRPVRCNHGVPDSPIGYASTDGRYFIGPVRPGMPLPAGMVLRGPYYMRDNNSGLLVHDGTLQQCFGAGPATSSQTVCVACGGTGRNSRGGYCVPCVDLGRVKITSVMHSPHT